MVENCRTDWLDDVHSNPRAACNEKLRQGGDKLSRYEGLLEQNALRNA